MQARIVAMIRAARGFAGPAETWTHHVKEARVRSARWLKPLACADNTASEL